MRTRNKIIPTRFLFKIPEIRKVHCNSNAGKQCLYINIFRNSSICRNFMASIIFILIFGFFGCRSETDQTDKSRVTDSSGRAKHAEKMDRSAEIRATNKIDNSKNYTTEDTLIITNEIGDTFKYGKRDFNKLIDNHPELTSEYTIDPDQTYSCGKTDEEFDSEVGQDTYFVLYAYFLKNKNGDKKYNAIRKKMMDVYQNINLLYSYLQYGGSYFGHQRTRILGYAEYSVYLYKQNGSNPVSKTYDISKQKAFYIISLRQLINDESSTDFKTTGKAKNERIKKLNKIVDEIDEAITDIFYLRRTQSFHYGQYQYY